MLILLIITFLVSQKKVANRISQIYWKANRLKGGQRDEKQNTKQPTIRAGLHKLWYPGIRDMSTWSKFGAHGENGDVFLFSNLGAL